MRGPWSVQMEKEYLGWYRGPCIRSTKKRCVGGAFRNLTYTAHKTRVESFILRDCIRKWSWWPRIKYISVHVKDFWDVLKSWKALHKSVWLPLFKSQNRIISLMTLFIVITPESEGNKCHPRLAHSSQWIKHAILGAASLIIPSVSDEAEWGVKGRCIPLQLIQVCGIGCRNPSGPCACRISWELPLLSMVGVM